MDSIILIKPADRFIPEIESYRQEFLACGDSMDGTGDLRGIASVPDWITRNKNYEHAEFLPEGYVTAELFLAVRESDQKVVGMIQLRHELNEYLFDFGGHIGYSVRPSERRKGYAKEMLKRCLEGCQARGITRVLVTCLENNEGSRKTILANGGIYEDKRFLAVENEQIERYWITLKEHR
jgi:predicted acetyltransferase